MDEERDGGARRGVPYENVPAGAASGPTALKTITQVERLIRCMAGSLGSEAVLDTTQSAQAQAAIRRVRELCDTVEQRLRGYADEAPRGESARATPAPAAEVPSATPLRRHG
jgi:hypothetical protein